MRRANSSNSKLTARNQELVERRRAGASLPELAERFGVSKQRVQQLLLQLDPLANAEGRLVFRMARRLHTSVQRQLGRRPRRKMENAEAMILELRDQGLRQVAIARLVGLGQSTVSTILIRNGRRVQDHRRQVKH
jgi:DNA-binding CsgD family transcriptional regulator